MFLLGFLLCLTKVLLELLIYLLFDFKRPARSLRIRDRHPAFRAVTQDGLESQVLHKDAWEVLKETGCVEGRCTVWKYWKEVAVDFCSRIGVLGFGEGGVCLLLLFPLPLLLLLLLLLLLEDILLFKWLFVLSFCSILFCFWLYFSIVIMMIICIHSRP